MKNSLGRNIFSSLLGGVVVSTPIFATSMLINNSIVQSVKSEDAINTVSNVNEHGITLSKYEIESWTGVSQTIQVFNNNQAITGVQWTVDSNKFSVEEVTESNSYKVNFLGSWSATESNESKIHAHWTDADGYAHTSSCVVRIINNNRLTTDEYDKTITSNGTTTFEFNKNAKAEDFSFVASENADLLTNYHVSIVDDKLSFIVTPRSTTIGKAAFTFYHKNDTSKQYGTQITVLIAQNILSLDNTNISARVNDSVTIKPLLNGSETTSSAVNWYCSSDICYFKEPKSDGSVDLVFLKQSQDPVVLYCYETAVAEAVNYTKCYINITNSNLVISDKAKTEYDYKEGGVQLNAKLDGTDVSTKAIWSTSDASIAAVDDNKGYVTFKETGQVTISVTYTNENSVTFKDSYTFTITSEKLTVEPSSIVAFTTDTPKKIVAKLQGVEVPTSELTFKSDNPEIVSVDETGQLTYLAVGITKINCYYNQYYYLKDYHAVTSITITAPTLEFSLEWNKKTVGTHDQAIHQLPKAYLGGIELPFEQVTWTSSSESLIIEQDKFYAKDEGDFTLTCKYVTTGVELTQTVEIHAQDLFINNFEVKEPTISQEASSVFGQQTYQLTFWYDNERTKPIKIQSARSTNTSRATVTNEGFITFKGHGNCDIICELIYVTSNGEEIIKTSTVHLRIPVWWWGWLIVAVGFVALSGGIALIIIAVEKKKAKTRAIKQKEIQEAKAEEQEISNEENK